MSKMRELIKRELLRRDIIFSRPAGQFTVTEHKLAKVRDRGLKLNMVVDGGAANGEWAELLKHIYPSTKVLCVEPRADAQVELHRRAAMLGGISVAQTLLGAHEGTVDFFEEQHRSSALKNASGEEWGKKVSAPMTTLDALITKMQLPDPDLIKLDLQGYELECLKGATRCLAHAEAVLLEVSFIPIQQGMPLIGDVVPFMSQHGFQVYDITALWHRPLDGAMAQGDFLFIANRSKLLADSRWNHGE